MSTCLPRRRQLFFRYMHKVMHRLVGGCQSQHHQKACRLLWTVRSTSTNACGVLTHVMPQVAPQQAWARHDDLFQARYAPLACHNQGLQLPQDARARPGHVTARQHACLQTML